MTPVDDGNIEADETVVLTLSGTLAYSVGTPGSAVITIVDNDRPTVTVAATDGTEAGPTTGNFTFTRTGDTSIALTVNYAVTGTATQADYVETLSGVITFASGQSNVVAAVTPRLDALLEGNETIIATLTAGPICDWHARSGHADDRGQRARRHGGGDQRYRGWSHAPATSRSRGRAIPTSP